MSEPVVILMTPQMGENIGAAARVMANFGLTDLRIVAPRDGWPNPRAAAMAAGALADVVTARAFENLEDAVSDVGMLVAATARKRELTTPVWSLSQTVAAMGASAGDDAPPAVLFGPEASGLSNDAIARCDAIVSYPVNTDFPSLNLAQAVAVFAFSWAAGGGDAPPVSVDAPPPAAKGDLIALQEHLIDALDRAGFFFPESKADAMKRGVRALLARPGFTLPEVRTLRGAIKALEEGPRPAALRRKAQKAQDDPER